MKGKIIINGVEVDLQKIERENRKNGVTDPETSKSYDFVANSLMLNDVAAKSINIQPHNSNKIIVTVSGLQSVVDTVTVKGNNGVVSIGSSRGCGIQINNMRMGGFSSGVQIVSGNSVVTNIRNMTVRGDGVTIIDSDDDVNITTGRAASALTLEIKVPIGTDIDYDGNNGTLIIGDVEGDLQVDASGNVAVYVGKVKDVDLDISGSAGFDIKQVEGDTKIDISGQGNIQIHGGKINKLDIDVSGMGRVDVRCTAQRAKLDASGMGSIYVQHVIKPPRQDRAGMASIKVGHIG